MRMRTTRNFLPIASPALLPAVLAVLPVLGCGGGGDDGPGTDCELTAGVDITVDTANCGACGASCAKGEICEGGSCVSPAAACPDPAGLASGTTLELVMPMVDTFVPLCEGKVLVADMIGDVAAIYDIQTSTRIQEIPFDTQVGQLAVDFATNTAYVGSNIDSVVFAVDLGTLAVTPIDLPPMYAAGRLTVGPPGILFVGLTNDTGSFGNLVIIDTTKQPPSSTETDVLVRPGAGIAYDRVGRQLFIGALGSLERFAFDADTKTLSLTETLVDAGDNCHHVMVSPAGGHVAITCGGGNGHGYTIVDFDTNDLEHQYGEWETGPYPDVASFSPDGTKLIASAMSSLMVFDVETHDLLESYSATPMLNECSYELQQVAVSRGGGVRHGIMNCGQEPSGRLFTIVP